MKINMTTAFVASFVAIAGIAALANPSLVSGLVSPSAAQTAQTDTNGAAPNGQADTTATATTSLANATTTSNGTAQRTSVRNRQNQRSRRYRRASLEDCNY